MANMNATGWRERHARLLATAGLVTALGACAPPIELTVAPAIYSENWRASDGPQRSDNTALSWGAFASPEMERLIVLARRSNSDVNIALARVYQVRGALGVARSALFPTLDAGLGVDSNFDDLRGSGGKGRDSAFGNLDIAYEIDIFGAASADRKAARARLEAAGYDLKALTLLIESELANAYIAHGALSDRIALVERSLENARELERIVRIRRREGIASDVDVGLQSIEGRKLAAERSTLIEERDLVRNGIAVLIGREAPQFQLGNTGLGDLIVPHFAAVQPGELLARRPDIRAAENRVSAADGDVEVARKAFLPGLRVSASGFASAAGVNVLNLGLSAIASLVAPIFDGGRRRGDLLTARGRQYESIELFRKSLLESLAETQNALTAIERSGERAAIYSATKNEVARTAALARIQYIEGAADSRTVIDAEQNLLDIEDAYVRSRQAQLNSAVALFRAMGGQPST